MIKIDRAKRYANVGKYHRTWIAIIASMPVWFLTNSTAKQIAVAADVAHTSYNAGFSAPQN